MRSLWYQNTYCGGDGLWNKTSNGTLGGSRTKYVQVCTTSRDRREYTLVSHVQLGTKLCVSDRNSKYAFSTNGCSPLYTTPCPLVLSAAIRRFSSTISPTNFSSVSGRNSEFRTVGGPTCGEVNEEKHIFSVFVSSALHVLLLLLLLLLLYSLKRNHDNKSKGSTATSELVLLVY